MSDTWGHVCAAGTAAPRQLSTHSAHSSPGLNPTPASGSNIMLCTEVRQDAAVHHGCMQALGSHEDSGANVPGQGHCQQVTRRCLTRLSKPLCRALPFAEPCALTCAGVSSGPLLELGSALPPAGDCARPPTRHAACGHASGPATRTACAPCACPGPLPAATPGEQAVTRRSVPSLPAGRLACRQSPGAQCHSGRQLGWAGRATCTRPPQGAATPELQGRPARCRLRHTWAHQTEVQAHLKGGPAGMLLLVGLSHLLCSCQVLHNLAPPPAQQRQPACNRCRFSAWPSTQVSPQQEPGALAKAEQHTARLMYH